MSEARLRRALVLAETPKESAVAKLMLANERGGGSRLTADEVKWLARTFEVAQLGAAMHETLLPSEEAAALTDEHGNIYVNVREVHMSVNTPSLDKLSEVGGPEVAAFLDWFLHERRGQLCVWRDAVPATKCPHDGKSLDELVKAGVGVYRERDPVDNNRGPYKCPVCNMELYGGRFDRHHDLDLDGEPKGFFPIGVTKEELIAEYAGVSQGDVDVERRALLDAARKASMASTERVP